jgi:YjbE family integral membrane protein
LFHYAHSGFIALLQVILIDITMAGDNAVVISLAAARVPLHDRRKVIFWGLVAAVTLRVILASSIRALLSVIGFTLAGGILLLWVCWRLYREINHDFAGQRRSLFTPGEKSAVEAEFSGPDEAKAVRRAIMHICVADASMSLDNVLAVAGASVNHPYILVIGLILSIGLMGVASNYLARLIDRRPWISYAGVFIVLYVAITMIVLGSNEVVKAM